MNSTSQVRNLLLDAPTTCVHIMAAIHRFFLFWHTLCSVAECINTRFVLQYNAWEYRNCQLVRMVFNRKMSWYVTFSGTEHLTVVKKSCYDLSLNSINRL